MGKTLGTDFSEGKVTLPLIHAINSVSHTDQQFLQQLIEQDHEIDSSQLAKVIQLIESSRAIEYTLSKAKAHINQAISQLACVPDGMAKQALVNLCEFCIQRTY
jgi:octaprenyl-diphosphate synthase